MLDINRIERPSTTFVKIGRLVYEFLKFIQGTKPGNQGSLLVEEISTIQWSEICVAIKSSISSCLQDFKKLVRKVCSDCEQTSKDFLSSLQQTYF
jgi:hypothetical protein